MFYFYLGLFVTLVTLWVHILSWNCGGRRIWDSELPLWVV